MTRPVWYYSNTVSEGIKEGISSFGNPLVWWLGIPAFFYIAYMAIRRKDQTGGFLVLSYLAQLLPWMPVARCTFIYHYFPSVAFVVLMSTYSLMQLKHRKSFLEFIFLLILYAAAVFGLFLLFYPVLSGQPVTTLYVNTWLRWFDSWVLIEQ